MTVLARVYTSYMRRILLPVIVILLILTPQWAGGGYHRSAQTDQAASILATMTPEERVGQLFIVTFEGNEIEDGDPIYDLIVNQHISGVLLKAGNDNFIDGPESLTRIRELISTLQNIEISSSNGTGEAFPNLENSEQSIYIPLFIATSHEGGGPYSEILSGLSELPTQMAIGATWDLELAYEVGEVLGYELDALGFNLLIGPSLDVLEEPGLVREGDLGVRSFGGDPYWVGQLGRAYISGLHAGSNYGLSVIGKHFPGLGSADRPIDEEVATVRKSLEQLKQIELAPFFSVTAGIPGLSGEIADGLLTSHIRYQGFQGNVRATTRPISLDPQAYGQLMALEPLSSWREAGGITVSDSLGSRAVRRFRDPTERTFKAHLVARDAFLAGNDILILADFQNPEDPDEVTTIKSTLVFFAQKYREDVAFAQLVDNAVHRILEVKIRIFGEEFYRSRVFPPSRMPDDVGMRSDVTTRVARTASTLVSPSQAEVVERLGGAPQLGEKILFFTDVRPIQQCSSCESKQWMNMRGLEQAVLSLYGQAAAGEVGSWNLTSYSMGDLAYYLGEPISGTLGTPISTPEDLEQAISSAQWLVFSVLDGSDSVYGSNALKLFLDQRPDLARNKRVVVFAHDIPYGLDATDISKVDVYYSLYGGSPIFIDVAAHLLFLEQSAPGASPVSIPGIGYDLIDAMSPDPDQLITLYVHHEGEGPPDDEIEVDEEDVAPEFSVGDTLVVRTGQILDSNGHHVPDGTVVEFILTQQGDNPISTTIGTTTQLGYAQINFTLERFGLLAVSARSDPARTSETLQLNIQEGVLSQPTVVSPTASPTTSAEMDTPQVPTPTATAGDEGTPPNTHEDIITMRHFFFGMVGVAFTAIYGYAITLRNGVSKNVRWRCILVPIVAGLLGYNYVALGLPGSNALLKGLGAIAGLITAIGSGLIGLIAARMWFCRTKVANEKSPE